MSHIDQDITEIARCGTQYRAEKLADLGLKAFHASFLREICACPGISQDKLARRICINKSNVARQAASLEEDGFIIRKPSPCDKRVLELYPTQKTLDLLPRIQRFQDCWEGYLTSDLTPEEAALVTGILQRMKEKASRWMEAHEVD